MVKEELSGIEEDCKNEGCIWNYNKVCSHRNHEKLTKNYDLGEY